MYDPIDICATLLELYHLAVELCEVVDCIVFAVGSEDETDSFGHGGREPERGDRVFLCLFVF